MSGIDWSPYLLPLKPFPQHTGKLQESRGNSVKMLIFLQLRGRQNGQVIAVLLPT